jgi:hypothetical protein
MPTEIATKLRLTAAALGCASRKELCARFAAVNPATACELDRLHKWMQGRSLPRSPALFADWAKLLGTDRSGAWLAECTVDAFLDEVASLRGGSVHELRDRHVAAPPVRVAEPAGGAAGLLGSHRMLCGAFACYSHAFSPHHRGQVIRGALHVHAGTGKALRAVYRETLLGDTIRLGGEVAVVGGTVHVLLREAGSDLPLFLALILPGPPAAVLCGIMAGPAFVAHHALPTGTRIIAVRVPDTPRLEASNRYLTPGLDSFADDLEELGLPVGDVAELDGDVAAFLGPGPDQVAPSDQAGFSALIDRLHLFPAVAT